MMKYPICYKPLGEETIRKDAYITWLRLVKRIIPS